MKGYKISKKSKGGCGSFSGAALEKMKKLLSILLLASVLCSAFALSASALFGSGVAVIAEGVTLVKSGLFGKKLSFSDADFKSALCIPSFRGITVTKLPKSTEGTLLLGGRRVRIGQTIKRKNIAALVFVPASDTVSESGFRFTVDSSSGAEYECKIKFTDKVNYAPTVAESSTASVNLFTQSDITLHGRLEAVDPEGDRLEYIIVSYPKNGTLRLTDKESGKYRYTPDKSFTGSDKFVFVVRDEWGNYSSAETVRIKTVERMSGEVFADMTDKAEYNAAVAISALGIMSGVTLGDSSLFMPEETVSRAEFVAMAMKAMGISPDTTLVSSFFDDNEDIPLPLMSYVATAQRLGIIDGSYSSEGLCFAPNKAITRYEAACIIAKILGVGKSGEEEALFEYEGVPVWARRSVYAMYTLGIFDSEADAAGVMNRADTAECLYRLIGR